jgi:transcriptional regulator with XRE-family HTH domain
MAATLWNHGDKAKLAKAVGITPQHLNEILSRRCRVPTRKAADALAQAAAASLGYYISSDSWLLNGETDSPYFGEKVKGKKVKGVTE